MLLNFINGFVD